MRSERRSTTPRGTMWCYNHTGVDATAVCPVCRRALCEACAYRFSQDGVCENCGARAAHQPQPEADAPGKLVAGTCYQHGHTPASVFCARCDRPMCRGCARPVRGRYACADCVSALERAGREPRTADWVAAAVVLVVLVVAYVVLRSLGMI